MKSAKIDYSPKLKEAMAEIKAVLTRHDIAGHELPSATPYPDKTGRN